MTFALIKTILKAKSNGLLHLVPASEPTRLDCLADKCAKCCKTIGVPVVTIAESEKIDATAIVRTTHGMFIRANKGVCCLLKDNSCSIYADRPKGCREYPWYNVNGRLYYDKGCPGIKHDIDQRLQADTIQPFENFFPRTSKPVLWLIKKICVRRFIQTV